MTWLDIMVVATVCLCAAYGFWKGIIRAVVATAGLLGGFLLAGACYRDLASRLWPTGGAWTNAAAYALILFGVLLAAAIIASLLSRLVHMTPLGVVDRTLGLVAGLLLALFSWALLLTIVVTVIPGSDNALSDSALAYRLIRLLAHVRGLPAAELGVI